jgi:hypothetical protein
MTTSIPRQNEEKKVEAPVAVPKHSSFNYDVLLLAFFQLLDSANVSLQFAQTDAKSLQASGSKQASKQRDMSGIKYDIITQVSQKQYYWTINGKNGEKMTHWTDYTMPHTDGTGNYMRPGHMTQWGPKWISIKQHTNIIPVKSSVYKAADMHNMAIQKDLTYLSGQLMALQIGDKGSMATINTDTDGAAQVVKQGLQCLSLLGDLALSISQMHPAA